MKFTKIRVSGPTNVDLPIVGADPAGPFVLKNAEGLGPAEVDVKIQNTLYLGGVYQGRRPQNREVSLRVGLQPDYAGAQTSEELRTILYGLLTPRFNQLIKVQIMNEDVVVAEAEGQIKRFEPALFSKDPEVTMTIACPQPYFVAPFGQYVLPETSVSGGYTYFNVDNPGTAPSGFWLGFILNSGHNGTLQILDGATFGGRVSINRTWVAGDRVTMNTVPGLRGIWKKAAAGTPNPSILDDLTSDSDWLELHGGLNTLRINNTDISWYLTGVSHVPAYWGV